MHTEKTIIQGKKAIDKKLKTLLTNYNYENCVLVNGLVYDIGKIAEKTGYNHLAMMVIVGRLPKDYGHSRYKTDLKDLKYYLKNHPSVVTMLYQCQLVKKGN